MNTYDESLCRVCLRALLDVPHVWRATRHVFSQFLIVHSLSCTHTPHSDVDMLVKGMLGGDDDETVIDSSGQDSDAPRDYVRGLAQRATEPYFKQNKAKGPFVVRMRAKLACMPCSTVP